MKNNKQILTITDAALNRVKFLMKKTDNDIVGLRVGIKTAGCSGLKYNIEYAKEVKQFEEKVFVDEIHESIWGTSDAIILAKNKICVIDFKFGKFPVKHPSENYQLWIYGLGALARYGNADTKMELTIVQPRSTNKKYIQTHKIDSDALVDWGFSVLKPSAEACFEDNPPKRAGEWCRFCNYKSDCDEYKLYEKRVENDRIHKG